MKNKKLAYEMYSKQDIAVSEIAKKLDRSESTIYRYIQELYDKERYPELKKEIKEVLICGDFTQFIKRLSYRDISLLRRKLGLYGTTKTEKINSILKYFKSYSILGVYPENLDRSIIKKAYFKKAKSTHPDLNKNQDRNGKAFQEVQAAYTQLLQIYA